jgi:small GTP-binding protein
MYDYLAKIVLLGPSGAGKSCLLHRFVKSEWRVLSSQTIGVEFASKIVKVGAGTHNAKRIKFQLWDTAGTERFRSVSRSYYRGAAGAVLVYDVASLASFQALPTFLSDARALASPQLTVVLAGNKADLADGAQSSAQSQQQQQGQSASSSTGRTQGIHMNGSAHSQRIHKDQDDRDRDPATPQTAASSASSRQSYFPHDSEAAMQSSASLKSTHSQSTTRSRGDTLTSLSASSKWTASQSPYGREVPPSTASHWASRALIPYTTEVSALSGDNVDTLFYRLAAMILTKIELGEIDPDDPASGIQYGDGLAQDDGGSVVTDGNSTLRRRKGGTGRKGVLTNLGEWEDVFRRPASARGGACC